MEEKFLVYTTSPLNPGIQEGMVNVGYKHSSLGILKTVPEKDLLLGFLSFLQGLGEPVVLFLHYKAGRI